MRIFLQPQELNAVVRAHGEGLDGAVTTSADDELQDAYPDNDDDSFLSVDDGGSFAGSTSEIPEDCAAIETHQIQRAATDDRLAVAVSARERAEILLQASEERSASLQTRQVTLCTI